MTTTLEACLRPPAWAALLGCTLIAGAAGAQERLFRSVDVAPGKPVRLGMAGNVSQECKPGPLPEVKVITAPRNGQLAIRDGKTKAGALTRCPSLEVPARGVFYEARARFNGTDEVAYEVRRPDGRVQVFTFKITVSEQAKPAPANPARESTDL